MAPIPRPQWKIWETQVGIKVLMVSYTHWWYKHFFIWPEWRKYQICCKLGFCFYSLFLYNSKIFELYMILFYFVKKMFHKNHIHYCLCRSVPGEHGGKWSHAQRRDSTPYSTLGRTHLSSTQQQTVPSVSQPSPSLLPSQLPAQRPSSPLWSPWLPFPLQQVQPGLPHPWEAAGALAVPCHAGGDRVPLVCETLPQSGSPAKAHAEHPLTAGQCKSPECTLALAHTPNPTGAHVRWTGH